MDDKLTMKTAKFMSLKNLYVYGNINFSDHSTSLTVVIHITGYYGIDQQGCVGKGCCWVPTEVSHYPMHILAMYLTITVSL